MAITAADRASANVRPPVDVLDHLTAGQHLDRVRREWRGADTGRRAEIEDDARYIKILQGVLP